MSERPASSNCQDCEHNTACFMDFVNEESISGKMHTAHIKYLRRQTLCKEGEFPSGVRLILEGFVKVFVEGPDKKNIIIKILKPGDFLGVSVICGGATYSFSASALTDTLVCSVDKDSVNELLVSNGNFAMVLAKWYCTNYGILLNKLQTIGFKNLHGRMADCILYLDNKDFKEGNLYKYLNRKDIAEFASTPMESAVRILSEFSDSKIIKINGKNIEILDYEMLNKISRGG